MENREASVSVLSRRPFRALHVDFVGTWLGYVGGRCLEEEELIRYESVEETACSGEWSVRAWSKVCRISICFPFFHERIRVVENGEIFMWTVNDL